MKSIHSKQWGWGGEIVLCKKSRVQNCRLIKKLRNSIFVTFFAIAKTSSSFQFANSLMVYVWVDSNMSMQNSERQFQPTTWVQKFAKRPSSSTALILWTDKKWFRIYCIWKKLCGTLFLHNKLLWINNKKTQDFTTTVKKVFPNLS